MTGSQPWGDELVLIVEDNSRNLELVQDILEFHGFRTLAATTGDQAVDLRAPSFEKNP
jgi:CheY-like chemotaxis protein